MYGWLPLPLPLIRHRHRYVCGLFERKLPRRFLGMVVCSAIEGDLSVKIKKEEEILDDFNLCFFYPIPGQSQVWQRESPYTVLEIRKLL